MTPQQQQDARDDFLAQVAKMSEVPGRWLCAEPVMFRSDDRYPTIDVNGVRFSFALQGICGG